MVSHVSAHTMRKQIDASSMCTAEYTRNDNGEHQAYTYCHSQLCSHLNEDALRLIQMKLTLPIPPTYSIIRLLAGSENIKSSINTNINLVSAFNYIRLKC